MRKYLVFACYHVSHCRLPYFEFAPLLPFGKRPGIGMFPLFGILYLLSYVKFMTRRRRCRRRSRWNSRVECVARATSRWLAIRVECTSRYE